MKKKYTILILFLATIFNLNFSSENTKKTAEEQDVEEYNRLEQIIALNLKKEEELLKVFVASEKFISESFEAIDFTLYQNVPPVMHLWQAVKGTRGTNSTLQQTVIDLINNCKQGRVPSVGMNALREQHKNNLPSLQKLEKEQNDLKINLEKLPKNPPIPFMIQLIDILIVNTQHKIMITKKLLSESFLGSKEKPGRLVKYCEDPKMLALRKRIASQKKEGSANSVNSATSGGISANTSTAASRIAQFKVNYPNLAREFDIQFIDIEKPVLAVEELINKINKLFAADDVQKLTDEAQLRKLHVKYSVLLNELNAFLQEQKKNMIDDELSNMQLLIRGLKIKIDNVLEMIDIKKYTGLAALTYSFEDFDIKPWNVKTAAEAEKVLNEMIASLKNNLTDSSSLTAEQKKMNESNLKRIEENYNKAINETINFLAAHLSDKDAAQFKDTLEKIRGDYDALFGKAIRQVSATSSVSMQTLPSAKRDLDMQVPAKSSAPLQNLSPAKPDPEWSEALAKQEKGSPITIANATNRSLWLAVYEKMKNRQPKRYGDVYRIEANGSNKDVRRPDWNVSQRASNDRYLYFSENKDDLALGVDHGTLGSIAIGEGSNLFSPKKDFTIRSNDLKNKS